MAQSRRVYGLKTAHPCTKPPQIPVSRPRKESKRFGLRYERAVARATGGLHGQWWHFVDTNGVGYCQTDVLLTFQSQVVILECKLTEVEQARRQLRCLYVPVVQLAMGRPAKGVVVARHLSKAVKEIVKLL